MEINKIKVSIIIPVYNAEKYLCECLEYAINQTLKAIEIICVNDASDDNSGKILEEYSLKDSRIKIINLPHNKGVGYARNAALSIAVGNYIIFCDADDFLDESAAEKSFNTICKNNADIGIFKTYYLEGVDENVKYEPWRNSKIDEAIKNNNYNAVYENFECFQIFVWGKIYKRDFIKQSDVTFCENLISSEDSLFNILLMLFNPKYCYIDDILYTHRLNNSQLKSITSTPNGLGNDFLAYKTFVEFDIFKNQPIDWQLRVVQLFLYNCDVWYNKYYGKPEYGIIKNDIKKFLKAFEIKYKIKDLKKLYLYNKLKKLLRKERLEKIFSVKNSNNHKVITILGVRIKFKRHTKQNK